jgi:hypothetical protein
MRIAKLVLSVALATSFVTVTFDEASAQLRRARAREEMKQEAEIPHSAAQTQADETAHQTNQQTRQQDWQNASPNEKQTTKNAATVHYEKKQTNEADAKAAVNEKASEPASGRRHRRAR